MILGNVNFVGNDGVPRTLSLDSDGKWAGEPLLLPTLQRRFPLSLHPGRPPGYHELQEAAQLLDGEVAYFLPLWE